MVDSATPWAVWARRSSRERARSDGYTVPPSKEAFF